MNGRLEASVERVVLPLRKPLRTAWGELGERELLLLRVRGEDGVEGVGEAAPLEAYDGVSFAGCRAGLERAAVALEQGMGSAAAREAGTGPGMAAVDVALLDLRARREGVPAWNLFADRALAEIEVNATIGAEDRASAAAAAVDARDAGFSCVKVKAGTGDDPGRVAAVRAAAGPDMRIRLDANGAWTVGEAVTTLRVLGPAAIELCEEPVSGLEAFRALRGQTDIPVAMDETAADPGAVRAGAADAVCLKIARCGGISGLLAAAAEARAAGQEVYLASSLDGPVGIAAALHAAALVVPDRPSGLATLSLFADLEDPFPPEAGWIAVPGGPGIGVACPA